MTTQIIHLPRPSPSAFYFIQGRSVAAIQAERDTMAPENRETHGTQFEACPFEHAEQWVCYVREFAEGEEIVIDTRDEWELHESVNSFQEALEWVQWEFIDFPIGQRTPMEWGEAEEEGEE